VTADFLSWALDCVAAEMAVDRDRLRPLERRLRHEQGGDRHYIGSAAAMDCADRQQAIRLALQSGATPAQVAERFGVSRQWVYQMRADDAQY
jgi:hypothetical protein